jgi:ribonucleoside-diphosphate reductase alpha chain
MMGIGNDHINISLSNCVVVESPSDTISSIMNTGRDLANLFKRRCGVGLDLSELRPEGAKVTNSAGSTSGAWSFADFYSNICRMIGQNGRRGALMLTMDIRHPDIEKFVTMKNDLTKVTGANISIKISDSFMLAVDNDNEFTLQFPVNTPTPNFTKTIKARELWEKIVNSATTTAEPGLLMWDNITKALPAECYAEDGFQTICTNPCAEIPLSAYDSCRLISINLKHMVDQPFTKDAKFNFAKLKEVSRAAMRLSDDLVDLEIEKLENILNITDTDDEKAMWEKLLITCKKGRRTGLGTHGLADVLSRLTLPYDADSAILITEKIYKTLKYSAYKESIELASERGAFPVFDSSKEHNHPYLNELPDDLLRDMKVVGRRNISILTNAPTGSVSILSQTSSGLEPVFRNSYVRRIKVESNEDVSIDFVDELGDKWHEFEVFHRNVQEWRDLNKGESIPHFFIESDQIKWQKRIEIQANIQRHIDHAISSTINLPKDTTSHTVSKIYLESWKKGLKGVTVYVDGSRSGVLVTNKEKKLFPQTSAPKRPDVLDCDIHYTKVRGEKWVILIGLLDKKPYEVFGGKASLVEIPTKYTKGKLVKKVYKTKISKYNLHFGYDGDEIIIKDVVKAFNNPNNLAFARMISLGLRHGTKVKFMVEQLQKDKDCDMFSFSKCIARILKSYIANGEVPSDKACDECHNDTLIYQDGCVSCSNCGYSKCS